MSVFSWILISNLVFIFIDSTKAIVCPFSYNAILNGCYKVNNGTNLTWAGAQQYCANDSIAILNNKTGSITHLIALESAIETTSFVYWMKAWGIRSQFWTDGIADSSSWSWSNQPIIWYFNSSEQAIIGNGSNYRLVYNTNQTGYRVVDDTDKKLSNFICEYQERCNTNNSCQNNGTCYLNVGRELCLCAAGFTGIKCEQPIDECLSSPCQHGGTCTDGLNNYTCDCSNIFFSGSNCETPNDDPTAGQRSAAFWSVFGVVCSLVALLTISDLPWDDIAETIGCSCSRFKCCSQQNDDDDDIDLDTNQLRSSDSPTTDNNLVTMSKKSTKGTNYYVVNTVWDPEKMREVTESNHPYNGYRSPDQRTTPDNVLIQSFTAAFIEKQKQKQLDEKRVYAVDINNPNNSTDKSNNPADTMVSWTQQLQEQLKNKPTRETSASSTKPLIQSDN